MKITMLLYTGPDHPNTLSLINIAKAAVAKGHEVTVFAMAAGVQNLIREDFTSLPRSGVNVTMCEYNRGLWKAPEGVEDIHYGSQYDLAGYAQECDRMISFL